MIRIVIQLHITVSVPILWVSVVFPTDYKNLFGINPLIEANFWKFISTSPTINDKHSALQGFFTRMRNI